jgi:hypothetical protein
MGELKELVIEVKKINENLVKIADALVRLKR